MMVSGVGTKHYFHQNHLYSVAAMTNSTGAVVERYRYDAYGKRTVTNAAGATIAASTIGQQRGFTGKYLDAETGLYDFEARMYSPTLGRFISRDPRMAKPLRDHGKVQARMVRGKAVSLQTMWGPSGADGYQDGMSLYSGYFVPNALDPLGEGVYEWCCKRSCDVTAAGAQVLFAVAVLEVYTILNAAGGAVTVNALGFVYGVIAAGSGYNPVGDAVGRLRNAWNQWLGGKWAECYSCCEGSADGCDAYFYQQ